MALTLVDMHSFCRQNARNALDPTWYSQKSIDMAIMQATQEWVRKTKQSAELAQITLVPGNATVTLPDGVKPEYLLEAYLELNGEHLKPDIAVANYRDILTASYESDPLGDNTPDRPTKMGFQTPTSAKLNCVPDKAYTLNLWWWRRPVSWTPGQAFITPTVVGGAISSLTIDLGGSIYSSAPTIVVTDDVGANATVGNVTVSYGVVTGLAVTAGGSGYVTPTVTVNGVDATLPSFGMDDDALMAIAASGAAYYLQRSEPANAAVAQANYKSFLDAAAAIKGRGAGQPWGRVITRETPTSY